MPKDRLSCVGVGLTSCRQLQVSDQAAEELRVLCLHGNSINSLEGLERLRQLVQLNASSNDIADIRPLQHLTNLTSLNLASNKVQSLHSLSSLSRLERLTAPHNFISTLTSLQPGGGLPHALATLDLHNNMLSSLQDLATLRAFSNLKDLKLAGGAPGNGVCNLPGYRQSVAQMLPQLNTLDGHSLDQDRQRLPPPQQASIMLPNTAALQPVPFPLPLTVVPQCMPSFTQSVIPHSMASANSDSSSPPNRALVKVPDAADSAQENRIAAIEARLHDMLRTRNRPALAPADNLLHRSTFQAVPQIRKIKPGPVQHEVACQTATSMTQLDRLQQDAANFKGELEVLAAELESRTSKAALITEQAEAFVHEAEDQAASKVLLKTSATLLYMPQTAAAFAAQNHMHYPDLEWPACCNPLCL